MNNGTDINQLMKDVTNNKLTNEENSMVDSIISDLNTGEREVPQQQKMPQLDQPFFGSKSDKKTT